MTAPRTVNTTCPYCGVGCGVLASVEDESARLIAVSGDPDHPANLGRLCSKGSALHETVGLQGRLLHPEIDGQRSTWDAALDRVASTFQQTIAEHGPGSVAFYVSGQLLTEDYYVANKLMKGFLGSANIDTNSRLCMASSVAGHKRAFGSDTVPGCYEDLELAELVVLTGSNTAWCHPVLYQRIRAAKEKNPRMKVVVIDPRRTATCEIADLHLALQPGTDTLLFNGLLAYLARYGHIDFSYIESHTQGFGAAIEAARQEGDKLPDVARTCGLTADDLSRFYSLFASTGKTVTVYSQGVNQSSAGTDKVNSIINCHLATGRIGTPGAGPFSVTGQPNAMGGREVGGLANQLAAHMDFDSDSIERVAEFWSAPAMAREPGLKAVDLFQAVGEGKIKALWIMATNPAVSLPDADRVRAAIAGCEFVVVSDCIADAETVRLAHVRLPAATWGEKDGTVTNSDRTISRQRAFLPLPGDCRPDWWIISEVGRRMGYAEAFSYGNAREIFAEHAALSGLDNHAAGRLRGFDISAYESLDDSSYESLAPAPWPARPGSGVVPRMFADGIFHTADQRARLVPIITRQPVNRPDTAYPLVLNTGRIRDQWHTMTRTGLSPRLSAHLPEPFLEIRAEDAATSGLEQGELAEVESRWGRMLARVRISDDQQKGSVFVPMHWSDQNSLSARMGALVNPVTDPQSGQPESKHTPVRVRPWSPAWHGFILSRRLLDIPGIDWRVRAEGVDFHRYELAGGTTHADWAAWARELLCEPGETAAEWVDFQDVRAGRYRGARIIQGRLESCLFVAPDIRLPERSWLAGLFQREHLSDAERASLLAGSPGRGVENPGPVICVCHGVGRNTLLKAIATQQLDSVAAVGQCTQAGTNCGSCIPEIQKLLGSPA